MSSCISGMCSVARGYRSTRSMPSRSTSRKKASAYRAVNSPSESFALAAPAIVLSSTSVRFMICVTRQPFRFRCRRRTSSQRKVRRFPMCTTL